MPGANERLLTQSAALSQFWQTEDGKVYVLAITGVDLGLGGLATAASVKFRISIKYPSLAAAQKAMIRQRIKWQAGPVPISILERAKAELSEARVLH